VDWDSSVGVATGYKLDGPGIESRWRARFIAPLQVFSCGKERPGRDADLSPRCSAEVKKEYSYTSTTPWVLRPVQSRLYKGALYFLLDQKSVYYII